MLTACIGTKSLEGRWFHMNFFVAETPGSVIFLLCMSERLGLVTLNCSINQQMPKRISSVHDLPFMYSHRFTGIGKFPALHKLTLKTEAKPVIHAAGRAPLQLQDQIKAKLNHMESLGVIRKVTQPRA